MKTSELDTTKKQNRATRREKIEASLYTPSELNRKSTAARNYDILSHVYGGNTWKLGFLISRTLSFGQYENGKRMKFAYVTK